MKNPEHSHDDDIFDVQYDICETLFDRIREFTEREKGNPAALQSVRDHIIQVVAAIEKTDPASIYRDLENVRVMTENG